jgi:hypothetical protein
MFRILVLGNIAQKLNFTSIMESKELKSNELPFSDNVSNAVYLMRKLRPDWDLSVKRVGATIISFVAEQRLMAPGAQVSWLTLPHTTTDQIYVMARRATIGFSLNHADVQKVLDHYPHIIDFVNDKEPTL